MDFIPYGRQIIDDEDIKAVVDALRGDFITTGPAVREFEGALCERCGCKYAVAVSSGTAALHIASLALLKPHSKVLVTPNTFLSTANSIVYAGCRPVFVDVDSEGNMDLDRCIELLEMDPDIGAVYGVHFSGNPLNQEKLGYIRDNFDVCVLEDCAHSLGAYDGKIRAGSCANSDASILSFHPVKHITTGEGGAVLTNDETLYRRLLSLRNNGVVHDGFKNRDMAYDEKGNINPWYYEMAYPGLNYRITDFQCALGISQLGKLDYFLKRRREIALRYDEAFSGNEIVKPLYEYKEGSSYHLYVIRVDFSLLGITRAELFNLAKEAGIGFQVHYIPVYRQPFYENLGYGDLRLSNMEEYYSQAVSIPMYPSLGVEQQTKVIDFILKTVNRYRK